MRDCPSTMPGETGAQTNPSQESGPGTQSELRTKSKTEENQTKGGVWGESRRYIMETFCASRLHLPSTTKSMRAWAAAD